MSLSGEPQRRDWDEDEPILDPERHWTHWFQAPRWFARMLQVDRRCPCLTCQRYWS